MKILHNLFRANAQGTAIGILNTLEEHPDEKNSVMWQRVVKTLVEVVYKQPDAVFASMEKVPSIPSGAVKTAYGLNMEIVPGEFTKKSTFVGFVGGGEKGRYCIQMDLLVDRERPNPIFIYTFEATLGSTRPLCKVASLFQSSRQTDESQSYKEITEADIVYRGNMAMGLAKTFHALSGLPISAEVAAACGAPGYSTILEYKC